MISQITINKMGILGKSKPFLRAIGHQESSLVGTIVRIIEGDGHEAEDPPCYIGLDNSLCLTYW